MSQWTLCASAPRTANDWAALVALLGEMHAAWADLDGLHVDVPAPAAVPLCSHLWAWGPGRWVRVRIDGSRWWASGLYQGGAAPSDLWRGSPEPVADVMTDVVRSWTLGAADGADAANGRDKRIGQLRVAEGVPPGEMQQLVPVRPSPAVYLGSVGTLAL